MEEVGGRRNRRLDAHHLSVDTSYDEARAHQHCAEHDAVHELPGDAGVSTAGPEEKRRGQHRPAQNHVVGNIALAEHGDQSYCNTSGENRPR